MYKKDFDKWNIEKQKLNNRKNVPYFKERDIWWVSFGVNIGYEIDGKNDEFERPAVILSKQGNNNALVVPLTSTVKESYYLVPYIWRGQKKSANVGQIRAIDAKRLLRKMGMMPEAYFSEVVKATKNLLENKNRPPQK